MKRVALVALVVLCGAGPNTAWAQPPPAPPPAPPSAGPPLSGDSGSAGNATGWVELQVAVCTEAEQRVARCDACKDKTTAECSGFSPPLCEITRALATSPDCAKEAGRFVAERAAPSLSTDAKVVDCSAAESPCFRAAVPLGAIRQKDSKFDPCRLARDSKYANVPLSSLPKLAAKCGVGRSVSGVAAVLAPIAANALGGFQDFLKERAKEEAVEFALDQFGRSLCDPVDEAPAELCKPEKPLKQKCLVPTTCGVLFPSGGAFSLDDEARMRLRDAVQSDLLAMPQVLLARWVAATQKWKPDERVWMAIAESAFSTGMDLVVKGGQPVDFGLRWDERARRAFKEMSGAPAVTCSFANPPVPSSCVGLLFPTVGGAVARRMRSSDTLRASSSLGVAADEIAAVLQDAAETYCAAYGPEKEQSGGACLFGPNYVDAWHGLLVGIVATFEDVIEVQRAIARLREQGFPPGEIAKRVVPDLSKALGKLAASVRNTVERLAQHQGTRADGKRASVELSAAARQLVAFGMGGAEAIASAAEADYRKVALLVLEAAKTGGILAELQLPDEAVRSISLGARLASAKDKDEARKVIEEAAAPHGSWRMKYGREKRTIAINAFVGGFAGYQRNFHVQKSANENDLAVRLAAPVGVDVTLYSSRSAHLGVGVSLFDPLAISVVNQDGETTDVDWGALVAAGGYVRWGIARSPFALMAGATYQPWLASSDACDGDSCWRGAFQVGGALAIDVPLVVLR